MLILNYLIQNNSYNYVDSIDFKLPNLGNDRLNVKIFGFSFGFGFYVSS